MGLKFQNVAHLRPPPPVNRLVIVPHHRNVRQLGVLALDWLRQQRHQIHLQSVGVLKLIDHQILKARIPTTPHLVMLLQKLHGQQKQIVEVHRVEGF